jgi:hypothetical protein
MMKHTIAKLTDQARAMGRKKDGVSAQSLCAWGLEFAPDVDDGMMDDGMMG